MIGQSVRAALEELEQVDAEGFAAAARALSHARCRES